MTAETNFGIALYMGTSSADVAAGLIGGITEVTEPPLARDMVNITTHDSASDSDGGVPEEFAPDGTYDPGEIPFTMYRNPGSTGDEALIAAFASRAKKYFRIVDNSATTARAYEGYGYVMAINPASRPVKGMKTAAVRIKRTGVWTRGNAS